MPTKTPSYDNKEDGDEEDSQQCCGQHSSHNTGTDRILRTTTCTVTDNQRHNPRIKAVDVIRIDEDACAMPPASLQSTLAFFIHQVFGKLDDQDGVLSREADCG